MTRNYPTMFLVTKMDAGDRCGLGTPCAEEEGSQVLGTLSCYSALTLHFPLPDTVHYRTVRDTQDIFPGVFIRRFATSTFSSAIC